MLHFSEQFCEGYSTHPKHSPKNSIIQLIHFSDSESSITLMTSVSERLLQLPGTNYFRIRPFPSSKRIKNEDTP
jgi:hypothetical protein